MAITGWREFPAFVGGRRAAKAGKGRELSGGNYRASGGGAWPSGLRARSSTRRWRRWPGRPRTRARPARARSGQVGQPGAEPPTGWRSQNQADDDEGQCHRRVRPDGAAALLAGGPVRARRARREVDGRRFFVGKGQFTADVRAVVVTVRGILDHFAQQGASGHGMVFAQNRCHAF